MSIKLDQLLSKLNEVLGNQISRKTVALDEITIECKASEYLAVCQKLRDTDGLKV